VATRAVLIEMNVVNPNVGAVVNNKLLFEFGPTGEVTKR
jgi:hypothetical protein